jgi:inner membrane protein YidH
MSDDELANDRTFLAWLRTGIATMGLGFVVAKVALILQPTNKTASNQGLYAAVGIVDIATNQRPWTLGDRRPPERP